MDELRSAVGVIWLVFWLYWLVEAVRAKKSARGRSGVRFRLAVLIALLVIVRLVRIRALAIHSLVIAGIGVAIVVCGLALAVWARAHLGRNWGMPMSQKDEPELVTSGPYRLVRHPIYTGLILGLLGAALTVNLIGLVVVAAAGGYFYYAATVEEKNLTASLPGYATYRAGTKMLIPFLI